MKKLFLATLVALSFASCKKSSDETPAPSTTPVDTSTNNTGAIGAVPSSFTQKVLVEMFTSASFGACPDGLTKLDQTVASNSSKIIPTCIKLFVRFPFHVAQIWIECAQPRRPGGVDDGG